MFHTRVNVHLMLEAETEQDLSSMINTWDNGKNMVDAYIASSKEAARELKNAVSNAKKGVDRVAAQQKQKQLAAHIKL